MAITTQYLTGFEHGFVGSAATAGAGLFDTVTSGCTASTTTPRNGTYCADIVAPASTVARIGKAYTQSTFVTRFGIKVSSRPSSATAIVFHTTNTGNAVTVTVSSTGVLTAAIGANTATGPTIDTTNWHLVELQFSFSGANGVLDWKVDGAAQTAPTPTTASALTALYLGTSSAAQPAFTADYDDWIVGTWTVAGTDWYGDGKVIAQLAGVDGAHSGPANLSSGDAGTAFSGATSTAYQRVDDPPGTDGWTATRSTTDNIAMRIATAGAYMEIKGAVTAEAGQANAVRAIISYSSSTTTANLAGCDVYNSAGTGTRVELWGLISGLGKDYSETANQFKGAIVATPGAGWTAAQVNLVRVRFGGCTSVDISPVPTLQAMMLEVDWPVATASAAVPDVLMAPPAAAGYR